MNLFFKKSRIRLYAACILAGASLLTTGCGARRVQMKQRTDTAMGTVIRQSVYVTDEEADPTGEIMENLRTLESETLSWRLETSELYRINETAGLADGVSVSQEMARILEKSKEVSQKSKGAFDVTIGSVVRLWNIDEWTAAENYAGVGEEGEVPETSFTLPDEKELANALESSGYEKLSVEGNTVRMPAGMKLDLGAVGKGIALDETALLLKQMDEVSGAVISVGGSILTYGSKPDGSRWRVGIVDPMDTSANLGYLELEGQWCVSTSGDYERYVQIEGKYFHHIMDPATGYPADSGVHSVTILTGDGFLSDALSTACFVLGIQEGLELAEEYGAEALFVDERGEIIMTQGMEQYFHSLK